MKKFITSMEKVVESPYTGLFLSIFLIYTSVQSIYDTYESDLKPGVNVNHGIALYGLVLLIKSLVAVMKSVVAISKYSDNLKGE